MRDVYSNLFTLLLLLMSDERMKCFVTNVEGMKIKKGLAVFEREREKKRERETFSATISLFFCNKSKQQLNVTTN